MDQKFGKNPKVRREKIRLFIYLFITIRQTGTAISNFVVYTQR